MGQICEIIRLCYTQQKIACKLNHHKVHGAITIEKKKDDGTEVKFIIKKLNESS